LDHSFVLLSGLLRCAFFITHAQVRDTATVGRAGDCAMADGMDAERVVRVGFLNTPNRRETFESMFDVVLDGVSGLEYPLSLLEWIAAQKKK
jgi:hypothetical protein